MGVLTDFFVADVNELAKAFPTWLAVADTPTLREVTNPFTGEMQVVEEWQPKHRPAVEVSDEARIPNYGILPNAEFKRVDTVMLATLQELISDVSYDDASKQFNRPALIDPWESNETGLFRLSDGFVTSLALISEGIIPDVAAKWAETEEMQLDRATPSDCETVVRELKRLAIIARETGRAMYYCWSL
jgi:hypothetical protein